MENIKKKLFFDEEQIIRGFEHNWKIILESDVEEIKEKINQVKNIIQPGVTYEVFDFKFVENHQNLVLLSNGVLLKGEPLGKCLKECTQLILVGYTLGKNIDTMIQDAFEKEDYYAGFLFDTIANRMLLQCRKQIFEYLKEKMTYNNMKLTVGMSPGDEGWGLADQKNIVESLQLEKLGIQLLPSMMMKPMKTVTMILGLGEVDGFSGDFCSRCNVKGCILK